MRLQQLHIGIKWIRNACLILLCTVFSFSPATASEKAESVDAVEEVYIHTQNRSEVSRHIKDSDTESAVVGTSNPLADRIAIHRFDLSPSKLYIIYQSLKLFD